jgi:hypothetical protein
MSNLFLHATWEQQTKESTVVGGISCCVILECLVTSTTPNKMADNDMSFRQRAVIEFLVKEEVLEGLVEKNRKYRFRSKLEFRKEAYTGP